MHPGSDEEISFLRLLHKCEAMLLTSQERILDLGEDLALKIPVFISHLLSNFDTKHGDISEFIQKHKPRVQVLSEGLRRWETEKKRREDGDHSDSTLFPTRYN